MKITDCHWELKNIGKRTIEVSIDRSDLFDKSVIGEAINGCEYAVVKIPMDMIAFNIGLASMGFICIETQLNVSCKYKDFDFEKHAPLYSKVSFREIDTRDGMDSILSNISPGMFSTDRIALDPVFGVDASHKRYTTWLKHEYESGRSKLISVYYEEMHVGFMLLRIEEKKIGLLLNGLYKPYQGKGLGLLTPASPMFYAKWAGIDVDQENTSISSNNIPVVKLYNRLHFQVDSQTYVFVKHVI